MKKLKSMGNNKLTKVCTSKLGWLFHIGGPVFCKLVADRFALTPFSDNIILCNRILMGAKTYKNDS